MTVFSGELQGVVFVGDVVGREWEEVAFGVKEPEVERMIFGLKKIFDVHFLYFLRG